MFCLLFIACNLQQGTIIRGAGEPDEGRSQRQETATPIVSIDSDKLQDIDSSNVSHFTILGRCSEEGGVVEVSVGEITSQTNCVGGVWESTLDVTGFNKVVAPIAVVVEHFAVEGEGVGTALESVINNFVCPENFVGIPSLEDYTIHSFCVAKYEMKSNGVGGVVSQAKGTPLISNHRDEALVQCVAMGGGYDLITNDGWQSIARNIELVPDNWGGSLVGSVRGLSRGYVDGSSSPITASEDDNDGCFKTGHTCDGLTWHSQRRIHTLSNGEVLWDLSGNVWEWVKDYSHESYGQDVYISQVTDSSHSDSYSLTRGTTTVARTAKGQFGPSGDYSTLNSVPYGGLGYGYFDSSGGEILRGGSLQSAGVFQVALNPWSPGKAFAEDPVGFRCVYYPGRSVPSISLDSGKLRDINSSNASNFTISGRCSEEGEAVEVSVGSIEVQTDCVGRAWEVILDVTSLNKVVKPIFITVDHSSGDGRSASQVLASVTNNFLCPTNFVSVPSLGGYTLHSFCVAKYEMKSDGIGGVVSQAKRTPVINTRRDEAITQCTSMGEGYDLITNDGWQSIARNIERVPENWMGNSIGLLEGLSRGYVNSSSFKPIEASTDDSNGCFGTGETCDDRTWHSDRRTHTLSNGEVIWDLSGNVWEWVKDRSYESYGRNIYMSKVTRTSHFKALSLERGTTTTARVAKDQFGPAGDYSSLNSIPYGRLGYGYFDSSGGEVLRGGGRYGAAGLFQVSSNPRGHGFLNRENDVGFRCVYYPGRFVPQVSINDNELEDIDSSNASSFTISGDCSEEREPVEVRVGGVKAQTDCVGGVWEAILDVTRLNKVSKAIPITVDHFSGDGRSAPQAVGSVGNDFICPSNFVAVPSLRGYTSHSFCIAKYEIKRNHQNELVFQPEGSPVMDISRNKAINKCQNRGARYDLVTNDEWQSMVRNIELVPANWFDGVIGSSLGLNQGHSDGSPDWGIEASSDDRLGCYKTGELCSRFIWNRQKRTHILSNGEVIWDLGGNVSEWVKDHTIWAYGSEAFMSQVTKNTHRIARSLSGGTTTTARVAKDQFGPTRSYETIFTKDHFGGLGFGWLAHSSGAIFRGGSWEMSSFSGVFTVGLLYAEDQAKNWIGFRCAYHP